jgi:hypothetical protein
VIDAVARIPKAFRRALTFYSVKDRWMMHPRAYDEKLCEQCKEKLDHPLYQGNQLRTDFHDHIVEGYDLIEAVVHPHCRCHLHRVTKGYHPQKVRYHVMKT